MALRIYDTLTREKREFTPLESGRVRMYVCGMTVQDRPHVGHIRSAIVNDTIRRYLVHLGYDVTYIKNFTDVDDKIIEKARQENVDYRVVAERSADQRDAAGDDFVADRPAVPHGLDQLVLADDVTLVCGEYDQHVHGQRFNVNLRVAAEQQSPVR